MTSLDVLGERLRRAYSSDRPAGARRSQRKRVGVNLVVNAYLQIYSSLSYCMLDPKEERLVSK